MLKAKALERQAFPDGYGREGRGMLPEMLVGIGFAANEPQMKERKVVREPIACFALFLAPPAVAPNETALLQFPGSGQSR